MLIGLLRGNFEISSALSYILSSLAVIFLTLPIHEFAHALVATKLGDPTPRYEGRLTLNPFAHIDYIGAVCILLFGFGWAKPVGINARYFKNPKWGMALSALAGPLSNVVVATLCFFIANLLSVLFGGSITTTLVIVYSFFIYVAQINIYLAVFNLVPIPPLDGSRLLFAFLPAKYYFSFMKYERYISLGLIVLIWIGVLDVPLGFLSSYVARFAQFVAGLPFMFF